MAGPKGEAPRPLLRRPVGHCVEALAVPGEPQRDRCRERTGAIHVLHDGFDYEGRHYASLSTIAREVTGTSWNGFLWAGLTQRKRRSTQAGGNG